MFVYSHLSFIRTFLRAHIQLSNSFDSHYFCWLCFTTLVLLSGNCIMRLGFHYRYLQCDYCSFYSVKCKVSLFLWLNFVFLLNTLHSFNWLRSLLWYNISKTRKNPISWFVDGKRIWFPPDFHSYQYNVLTFV